MRVPFARPSIGDAEVAAVESVLRSGWLTTGSVAQEFERAFAASIDAPHALAVSSATAGLHLALEAIGVCAGATVLVPSLTFTATAEVARYLGAEVEFVDVDPDTLVVTGDTVADGLARVRRRGDEVAAVIVVHLAGYVCDVPSIRDAVGSVPIVEDAAHAYPAGIDRRAAGTFGEVGVFSFYANKTITTGEGGMVVTSSPTIAQRISRMRLHGIDREAWDRYTNPGGSWRYDVVAPGFKYNLPDTAAAIGLVQLQKAESLRDRRVRLAERYATALGPLAKRGIVHLPATQPRHAWHLFILRLASNAPIERDTLIARMAEREIGLSVHYLPLHRMSYWSNRYPDAHTFLPVTSQLSDRLVSLPLYPDLDGEQQAFVIACLLDQLGGGEENESGT